MFYLVPDNGAIGNRMVLVCGTSTCHMAVSESKLFIPGVWGPFWSGISSLVFLEIIYHALFFFFPVSNSFFMLQH